MKFLIGSIEPNTPNEPNFGREPGSDPNVDPKDLPKVESEIKKTNWVLYGLLGLVALSIILGNKK